MSLLTLEEFINKWLGKKADYDDYYGGQCVDLYRFYVKEVLGFPQSPGVGGAAEIWDTADPDYYDFIDNTPTAIPEPGDIPIWNRNAGGGFGHVSVVIIANINTFVSFDQNWPTLSVCTKTTHNYDNIIGWLRPKKENMSDEMMEIKKTDFTKLINEANEKDEKIKNLELKLKESIEERDKLGKKVNDLSNELKEHKCPVIDDASEITEFIKIGATTLKIDGANINGINYTINELK